MGSKVNLKKLIVLTVFKKMIMIMIITMMMMMMRRMRRIVTVMVMIMMMFTMIVRMMVTICRLLILGRPQFKYGGGYLTDYVDSFDDFCDYCADELYCQVNMFESVIQKRYWKILFAIFEARGSILKKFLESKY